MYMVSQRWTDSQKQYVYFDVYEMNHPKVDYLIRVLANF